MNFSLESEGNRVQINSFGATLKSWKVQTSTAQPSQDWIDVLLGWDRVEDAQRGGAYLGSAVGRVANRIRAGRFSLNGSEYNLPINNGPNHLHGGPNGFSKSLMNSTLLLAAISEMVEFKIHSQDGDEGYPGAIDATITYELVQGSLSVRFEVKHAVNEASDLQTIVNPTVHPYFNLSGGREQTILDHEFRVYASQFVPTDKHLTPSGKLESVLNTPLDFYTLAQTFRAQIDQLRNLKTDHKGYDHFFYLPPHPNKVVKACELTCAATKLRLEVFTDCQGVQVYTGNWLDVPAKEFHSSPGGIGGRERYGENAGVAIECHSMPDAVNYPEWAPSVTLKQGEVWKSETKYVISHILI